MTDQPAPQGKVDLYEEIVRLRRDGRRAALATIIRRQGSAPRKDAAKMLVRDDGSVVGSVGGGCVEAEVWQAAQTVMQSTQPTVVKYHLTDDDAGSEGLICGGTLEVFVEPILPDPEVFILGAGHLGKAIAEAASPVGFRVTVIDDRDTFVSPERFPTAANLVVSPLSNALKPLEISRESFLLIVTRGHSHDQVALEACIQTPARYVGMVGSRRKIKILVENLLEKGHPKQAFHNLYAPIGIEIGSETPEEIAVSVVAEMIAIRRGTHQRSEKQKFISSMLETSSDSS